MEYVAGTYVPASSNPVIFAQEGVCAKANVQLKSNAT